MSETSADAGFRRPLILRNRAFGAVWLGQVLTQAAVRMFQVGASWWVVAYAVDRGRGLASGLLMAVSTLPAVALAPVVARVIAHGPRRRVLRRAAVRACAVAAALAAWAWAGELPLAAVYAGALALATCQAFFDPCLTTSVPELVDDQDIEAATGFELSTQSLAGLCGALLGALVVDRVGVGGLAVGCAAAYLAAALCIAAVRFRVARGPDGAAPALTKRPLAEILHQLPYVRRILICFTAANLFTTAVFVVIPLYTRNVLGGAGGTVGLLEASLGTGTLVGSFIGARVPGRPTITGAYCLGLMAIALALPGLVADRLVIACCLAVVGCCVGIIGVRFVALFQRMVPPADKPGFFAVMQALLGAAFPVASLLFGVAGDHLPAQTLCLVQAAGLVPAACALALLGGGALGSAAQPPTPGTDTDGDTGAGADDGPPRADPRPETAGGAA